MKEAIKLDYNMDNNPMMCYKAREFANIKVQGSIA